MIDRIGQKVVCIGGFIRKPYKNEIFPTVGEVYTVRAFSTASHHKVISPAILLREIINEPSNYEDGIKELPFKKSYFRPLISSEKKFDLSIFLNMGITSKEKELV